MFRIRRVYDDTLPSNRRAVTQVQAILRAQFPTIKEGEVARIPDQLRDPLRSQLRSLLFVAEDLSAAAATGRASRGDRPSARRVRGFALALHAPDLDFLWLDWISTGKRRTGGGVGGALYDRVREEAAALGTDGVFFESLTDDPERCRDPRARAENARRFRFYERFGARLVVGTDYEAPLYAGDDCPPGLVYDDLGRGRPLRRDRARTVVRAILERKYTGVCSPEYVEHVVASFTDDPVRLRAPTAKAGEAPRPDPVADDEKIALIVNARHDIHHVRERGYVESPVRVRSILGRLLPTGLFEVRPERRHPLAAVTAVHDAEMVRYFRRVCASMPPGESLYPYVFPIRNVARPPRDLALRAGYYCIDTFTPLNHNAWLAARGAVDCALTGAQALADGTRLAYALVRPPGHHAERRAFGGFCYLNNTAIAAHALSRLGRVAILDVDYHHGNGQQDIFYERDDVLTVSLHGHPRFAYPYFSGFSEERGSGPGIGFNLNLPLPEALDGVAYRRALDRALRRVERHRPAFLVVALGLDTARGDPTGTWSLLAADFTANGELIGGLGLPTLVVQEGGYDSRVIGTNARAFFTGLWRGAFRTLVPAPRPE